MLSERMEKVLNDQINAEMYSAYLYLSMAAYFDSINLKGFSNWMRMQEQEESMHAMKLYDYVLEKGGKVTLAAIDAPQTVWDSAQDAFQGVRDHEAKVTGLINDLVDVAMEERDHATNIMLQWFVTEQVEEESNAQDILEQLKLVAEAPGGMFMLDRELSQRVFTAPAAAGGA